jgi:hypothetical protein
MNVTITHHVLVLIYEIPVSEHQRMARDKCPCGYVNERSLHMKVKEFLDLLSDYKIVKKDPTT